MMSLITPCEGAKPRPTQVECLVLCHEVSAQLNHLHHLSLCAAGREQMSSYSFRAGNIAFDIPITQWILTTVDPLQHVRMRILYTLHCCACMRLLPGSSM